MISCSNRACARLVRSKLNCETFQTLLSRDTRAPRAVTARRALQLKALEVLRFEGFFVFRRAAPHAARDQINVVAAQPSAALAITTAHGGTRQNTSAMNATSAAAKSRDDTIVSRHTG